MAAEEDEAKDTKKTEEGDTEDKKGEESDTDDRKQDDSRETRKRTIIEVTGN